MCSLMNFYICIHLCVTTIQLNIQNIFSTPEGSLGVLYLHVPKCCNQMFVVSDVLVNV